MNLAVVRVGESLVRSLPGNSRGAEPDRAGGGRGLLFLERSRRTSPARGAGPAAAGAEPATGTQSPVRGRRGGRRAGLGHEGRLAPAGVGAPHAAPSSRAMPSMIRTMKAKAPTAPRGAPRRGPEGPARAPPRSRRRRSTRRGRRRGAGRKGRPSPDARSVAADRPRGETDQSRTGTQAKTMGRNSITITATKVNTAGLRCVADTPA